MFSCRVVTADNYQSPPVNGLDVCYSDFRNAQVRQVPVVRIFGATPAGQKTCMHVHGIFPYFYVPYSGEGQASDFYTRQFALSLDKALNIALNRAASNQQHVYKVAIVSARPFYGYYDKEQLFLKVFLYNPFMVKKAADLLLGGAVMSRVFQPYESHIPYLLQMFIDYNLYGMNMIDVGAVKFRRHDADGDPDGEESDEEGRTSSTPEEDMEHKVWDISKVSRRLLTDRSAAPQSNCELEVDVVAPDILNRLEVQENTGGNPGLAGLWQDEKLRCIRQGLPVDDLQPPSSPGRPGVRPSPTEQLLLQQLQDIVLQLQSHVGEESSDDDETEFNVTPASQLLPDAETTGISPDRASQDTVILDDEGPEAVVDEPSIHRVVSSSQSFHVPSSDPAEKSVLGDNELAAMLASLAQGSQEEDAEGGDAQSPQTTPSASRAVSVMVTQLEEQDSILCASQQPRSSSGSKPSSQKEVQQLESSDDEDGMELSQLHQEDEPAQELQPSPRFEDFNTEGLDATWNPEEEEQEGEAGSEGESDNELPQYDGPADNKSGDVERAKKRLGIRGPVSKGMFSVRAETASGVMTTFSSCQVQQVPLTAAQQQSLSSSSSSGSESPDTSLRLDLSSSSLMSMVHDHTQNKVQNKMSRTPHQGKNSPKEATDAEGLVQPLANNPRKCSPKKAVQNKEPTRDNIFSSITSTMSCPSAPEKTPNSDSAESVPVQDKRNSNMLFDPNDTSASEMEVNSDSPDASDSSFHTIPTDFEGDNDNEYDFSILDNTGCDDLPVVIDLPGNNVNWIRADTEGAKKKSKGRRTSSPNGSPKGRSPKAKSPRSKELPVLQYDERGFSGDDEFSDTGKSPAAKNISQSSFSSLNSSSDASIVSGHLDDCINAVANGTAAVLPSPDSSRKPKVIRFRPKPKPKTEEDDRIWLDVANEVQYYNSRRTTIAEKKTRHTADEFSAKVKILKQDCHNYDLARVGQESLNLKFLDTRDIEKLKYVPGDPSAASTPRLVKQRSKVSTETLWEETYLCMQGKPTPVTVAKQSEEEEDSTTQKIHRKRSRKPMKLAPVKNSAARRKRLASVADGDAVDVPMEEEPENNGNLTSDDQLRTDMVEENAPFDALKQSEAGPADPVFDESTSCDETALESVVSKEDRLLRLSMDSSAASSSPPRSTGTHSQHTSADESESYSSTVTGSASTLSSHLNIDKQDRAVKRRKRRKVERSDHYVYRDKRVSTNYEPDAFKHIYKQERNMDNVEQDTDNTEEQVKKKRRRRKPKPVIQYIIINKFKGYKSMRVRLPRLYIDVPTIKVSELKYYMKPRKLRLLERYWERRRQNKLAGKVIVSDMPLENKEDPLWEQQLQRLGDISSDDEDINRLLDIAERMDGQTQEDGLGPGKKKVVSYHKRLSNAFCKTNRKPRKKAKDARRFINTLSLLHQATLASLTDPTNASYGDKVEKDHVGQYEDVMYKLALFSPPDSEKGDLSPPVALSPPELAASKEHLKKVSGQSQESRPLEKPAELPQSVNGQDNMYISSPALSITNSRPSPQSLEDSRSETGSNSPKPGPPPYTVKEQIVKIGSSSNSPKKSNLKLNTALAHLGPDELLSPSGDGGLSEMPSGMGPASDSPTLNMPGQTLWQDEQQSSYSHNIRSHAMPSHYPSQDDRGRQTSGPYIHDRSNESQGQQVSEPLRAMEGMMSRMSGQSQYPSAEPNHHLMTSPPPIWSSLNPPPGQPFHSPRATQHPSIPSPGYSGQHYPVPGQPGSSPHSSGFHPVYPSGPPHHNQSAGQTSPSPHMMWSHPMGSDRPPSRPVSAPGPYFGHSYPPPGQDMPLSPLGITHGSPDSLGPPSSYFGTQHPLRHATLPPYYSPFGMHGSFHPPPYPGPPSHSSTSPIARLHGHPDSHRSPAQPVLHSPPYGPMPVSQHNVLSASKSPAHGQYTPTGHVSPRGSRTPSHESTPEQSPVTQTWSSNQSNSGPSPEQHDKGSPNQSQGSPSSAPSSVYSRPEQSPSSYPTDSSAQNSNHPRSQQMSPADVSARSPYPPDASPSPHYHSQQRSPAATPYMPDSEGQNLQYINQQNNYHQESPSSQYGQSDMSSPHIMSYNQHQQRSPAHMHYHQDMGSSNPHYPRPHPPSYGSASHYPTDNAGYQYNQHPVHSYPHTMPGHSPRHGGHQWMGHSDPAANQQPPPYHDPNTSYRHSEPSPTYTQLGGPPPTRHSPAASPVQSWQNNSWGSSAPTPAQRTYQCSPSHSQMPQSPSPSFSQPRSYQHHQQPIEQPSPSTSQGPEYTTPPPQKSTEPSPIHQQQSTPLALSDAKPSYSSATELAPRMSTFFGDSLKEAGSLPDQANLASKENFKQPMACVRRLSSSSSSSSSRRELEHIHCSSPIRSPSPVTPAQLPNESRDSPSTAEPEVVPSAKQSPAQVNNAAPPQTQTNSASQTASPKSQGAADNGTASPRTDASPVQSGQVSIVQSPPTVSPSRSDTEDSDSRPPDHEVVSICSLSPSNEDACQSTEQPARETQEPTQPSIIPLNYYGDQPGQVKGQSLAQSPDQHSSSTPNNQRQPVAKVKPVGLHYSDISDDEAASDAQRAAGHPSSPSSSTESNQKKTEDSNDSQSPAVNSSRYDCNMSDGLSILAAAAASKHGNDSGPAPASGDKDVGKQTGPGEANNSSSGSSSSKKSDGEDLGSSDQQPGRAASCSGSEDQTKVTLQPLQGPPSHQDVQDSLLENNLPHVKSQPPFCSDPADMPARDHGAVLNPTSSVLVSSLPEFRGSTESHGLTRWQQQLVASRSATVQSSQAVVLGDDPLKKGHLIPPLPIVLTPVTPPPTREAVNKWLKTEKSKEKDTKAKENGEKSRDLKKTPPTLTSSDKATLPPVTPQSSSDGGSQSKRESQPQNSDSNTKESEDYDVLPPTPPTKVRKTVTLLSSQMSTPSHSTPSGKMRPRFSQRPPSCTPISSSGKATPSAWQTTPTSKGFRTPKPSMRQRLSLSMQVHSQSPNADDTASQIQGPTPNNTYNFKVPQQNMKDAKALHEFQYITVLSVEVHATSRGALLPDPEYDAVHAIFYSIFNDVPDMSKRHVHGILVVDKNSAQSQNGPSSPHPSTSTSDTPPTAKKSSLSTTLLQKSGYPTKDVSYFSDETEMFDNFIQLVLKWNPDFLVGYEVQKASWGYLLQRGAQLNTDLATAISRLPGSKEDSHWSKEKDEYGSDHQSEIHIAGRIVLNLWRILRHELALNIYTYENIVYHVLHERVPRYSHHSLSSWWNHRTSLHRWRVLEYYQKRVKDNLAILEKLDIIGQTSEFARIFGIQFYHVLSRGSQYRVESMMLRISKPMNLLPVSPGVQQRARMRAPECIPLTLEPQSAMYTDPVVVLDFQSLYPSIMIAYNYCFSTCLGRLQHLAKAQEGAFDFGCTSLDVPPKILKKLQKRITICPNGVAFVKQSVKKGVLPIMVEEILETRFMVKKAMKKYKDDQTMTKLLHARQLGLKLIANVTFGYTSANFSGRMPCVEVGDSIVSKARETLERTISFIEENEKWGARVVYGDTDSVFVLLKGRSKEEAFKIGYDIVDAVSEQHPKPIKLKFEKVYLPCVLQTKKRYVGFMYETPEQKEPVFDAKGIETVRRDNCPAVGKILERSIKVLFSSRDVSEVRRYVESQCLKILDGTANSQDLIFAKEYRGAAGYKPGASVPALDIAKKRLTIDRRSEPLVGERVPYVVVYGLPGQPLIQLVRQPGEILLDPSLRINSTYYVTKAVLPPLQRIFLLLGVDVFSWYNNLPRRHKVGPQIQLMDTNKKGTISQYFGSLDCRVCGNNSQTGLCPSCRDDPQMSFAVLNSKVSKYQRTSCSIAQVCYSCTGTWDENITCISIDCPVLFRRHRAALDTQVVPQLAQLLDVLQNRKQDNL